MLGREFSVLALKFKYELFEKSGKNEAFNVMVLDICHIAEKLCKYLTDPFEDSNRPFFRSLIPKLCLI